MSSLNTPYGTLSFPTVFQPKPRGEGGDPVYSATIIFDAAAQQSPAFKALQDACLKLAQSEFPKVPIKAIKMPFRDAGEKAGKYAGYVDGDIFINTWSKSKPGIVNAQRHDILLPEEVWAGQLVRLNLTPFPWTHSGKSGVSFALNHVQIVRTDTVRIDGRASATSAFDDGLVEAEEESPF